MDQEVDEIKQRINNFLVRESSDDFNPRASVKDAGKSNLENLFDLENEIGNKESAKEVDTGDTFFRDLVSKIEKKHQNGDTEPIDFYQNAFKFTQKEKKPARKYDDEAFQRDLENFRNPFGSNGGAGGDDLDVKQIIKTALQVEDASRQIKSKHSGARYDALYQEEKAPRKKS